MIPEVRGVAGRPVTFSGYAQNFAAPICAIQFSCDDGRTWSTYETKGTHAECNVNWKFSFTPQRIGSYRFLVRALDARGNTTPEPAVVRLLVAEG